MPTLVIPNTFTPDTLARSAQVNANFTSITTLLNSTLLDSTNIQSGGIVGSNIAANTVSKANLAADVVDGATLDKDGTGAMIVRDAGVSLAKLSAAVAAALCPAGGVVMYAGASAPTGWLMCDGTAVSRSTYAGLYTAIGISHGQGNGSTTFNLPDYRGRFIRGTDNMGSGAASRDPDTLTRTAMATGGNTGNNVGSIQADALAAHTHPYLRSSAPGFGAGSSDPNSVDQPNFSDDTSSTGGAETRPINAYANFIIKT